MPRFDLTNDLGHNCIEVRASGLARWCRRCLSSRQRHFDIRFQRCAFGIKPFLLLELSGREETMEAEEFAALLDAIFAGVVVALLDL